MRRFDLASLLAGLLLAAIAVLGSWMALGGEPSRRALAVGAPLTLVAIGVVGLALARSPK